MLGSLHYWLVLAAGALWASMAPQRLRETGLAVLAFALVVDRDPIAASAYLAAALLVWWLVKRAAGFSAMAAAVMGLTAGLLICEIIHDRNHDWIKPLGLSYLVFRLIHYIVDARRNAWDRPPTLMEFLHFLFTPALFVAGPLERWGHWDKPVGTDRGRQIAEGVWRIVIGLLKKLYLADFILPMLAKDFHWTLPADAVVGTGAGEIWQACLYSYLKIYFEFSGYSDIAVGAGLLWARRPMENFNWPILAANPPDFWRRWHISIAQWCANCIYLPVMGLMRSVVVPMLASFIVMGLWHGLGWNRVGWAVYQVAGLLVFITWQKKLGRAKPGSWRSTGLWRVASIGMTQVFVVASYSFMLHGETVPITQSLKLLANMFGWQA